LVFASYCSPLLLYLSLSAFISSQKCLACSFTMIISSAGHHLTSTTTRLRPPSSRVPPRIRLEYAVRDGGKVNPADSRPDISHRADDVEIDVRPGLCGRQSEIGSHPSSSQQIAPHTVQGPRRQQGQTRKLMTFSLPRLSYQTSRIDCMLQMKRGQGWPSGHTVLRVIALLEL